MRPALFVLGAVALLATVTARASVVQLPGRIEVAGVIDGDGSIPGRFGDTMDYLTFEVLSMGNVTFTSGFGGNARLQLARFIGREDEFGFLGNPYRLEQNAGPPATFTRVLDPGIYVTAMGVREDTSYDVFDGYDPVNDEGGGFTFGNYSYSIEGPVRALEFREGNLDGTFTITRIPEPMTPALFLTGGAWLIWQRNGNKRGAIKALHQTSGIRLLTMLSLSESVSVSSERAPAPMCGCLPISATPPTIPT